MDIKNRCGWIRQDAN